jgi:hypothetical protein
MAKEHPATHIRRIRGAAAFQGDGNATEIGLETDTHQVAYHAQGATRRLVDDFTDQTIAGTKTFPTAVLASPTITTPTITGQKRTVISGQAATATLTAAQSGAIVLFDSAAGIVYTLPVPVVGLFYDFFVTVTLTSAAYEVITDAGTTFLGGSIYIDTLAATPSATVGPKTFGADPAATIKISSNKTTTGGILGSAYRLTCISATVWYCEGTLIGSAGAGVATPFAAA